MDQILELLSLAIILLKSSLLSAACLALLALAQVRAQVEPQVVFGTDPKKDLELTQSQLCEACNAIVMEVKYLKLQVLNHYHQTTIQLVMLLHLVVQLLILE